MIPIHLRHEAPDQLIFAHRPLSGWVAAGVGAALYGGLLVLVGYEWRELLSTDSGLLFATLVCPLVVACGIFVGLWRHQLTIERQRRQWRRQRGLWPFVSHSRGHLDDGCQVVLSRKRNRNQDSGPTNRYLVHLELGKEPAVHLGTATAQVLGQRLLVEMAHRLELPALDRSQNPSLLTPWKELEMPADPFAR